MAVLSLQDATVSFGGPPLLDRVSLHVEERERLALLGRNGAGKSTLLRALRRELTLDSGLVVSSPTTRVAWLGQKVPRDLAGPVFDIVAQGVPELGKLLAEVHHLGEQLATADAETEDGARILRRYSSAQSRLEAAGGYDVETRVATALSRLNLPAEAEFSTLSGGLKRRVLLARALAAEPDVLLLDEPTNHLDIAAIEWVEQLIETLPGAVVFVTHDRSFLAKVATRIVELDRGAIRSYPGNYDRYLEQRAADLEIQERAAVKQDRKLADEEVWIRQGIKARRTRNEGRVRALERLREEVRHRRKAVGNADLRLDQAEASGKHVVELKDVWFSYALPEQQGQGLEAELVASQRQSWVVKNFSAIISRGDKIGLLGPNGSGKTTLLKLMLRSLEPTRGEVKSGTRLEVAYFDQHREQLVEERSVADNVADGNDRLTINGQPQHVLGYLQRFLFSPEQARSPVSSLSGGERNRLLLARLFTRSFNVLVMDEPTNDLDIETLELLEDRLVSFSGTLLVVSHDRAFLDNVVTSTLVMEGEGGVTNYPGGYSDWVAQRKLNPFESKAQLVDATPSTSELTSTDSGEEPTGQAMVGDLQSESASPGKAGTQSVKAKPRKLTYKESRALAALPGRIEGLESRQAEIHSVLAEPDTYADGGDTAKNLNDELETLVAELEVCYEQWEELEQ